MRLGFCYDISQTRDRDTSGRVRSSTPQRFFPTPGLANFWAAMLRDSRLVVVDFCVTEPASNPQFDSHVPHTPLRASNQGQPGPQNPNAPNGICPRNRSIRHRVRSTNKSPSYLPSRCNLCRTFEPPVATNLPRASRSTVVSIVVRPRRMRLVPSVKPMPSACAILLATYFLAASHCGRVGS